MVRRKAILGPGGYGTILKYKDAVKEISEGFRLTTNNRMELLAVIKGLEAIKKARNTHNHLFRFKICCRRNRKGLDLGLAKKEFRKESKC